MRPEDQDVSVQDSKNIANVGADAIQRYKDANELEAQSATAAVKSS